jgi:hypothetical protein
VVDNLPDLVDALKKSVKTDIPTTELPRLLSLAEGVDTRDVRSYVFSPPFYGSEILAPIYKIVPNIQRIQASVENAFKGDQAQLEARREALSAEGSRVWVLNGSGGAGQATALAGFLTYQGIDASAPKQRPASRPPSTRVVVYNGAETRMPQTIAYLEQVLKTTVETATDPAVHVDILVTTAPDTPDLEAPVTG